MTQGRVNPNFRVEDMGIEGSGQAYYNLIEPSLIEVALERGEGTLGRGGMVTKVRAARLASRSGTQTLILDGRLATPLSRLLAGEALGTWLQCTTKPEAARRQWLASLLSHQGVVELDAGAVSVLRKSGRSLLPVGVTGLSGVFSRGDLLLCRGPDGQDVARGLSNYSSEETAKIIGKPSQDIASCLGYVGEDELIHRDKAFVDRGFQLAWHRRATRTHHLPKLVVVPQLRDVVEDAVLRHGGGIVGALDDLFEGLVRPLGSLDGLVAIGHIGVVVQIVVIFECLGGHALGRERVVSIGKIRKFKSHVWASASGLHFMMLHAAHPMSGQGRCGPNPR